VVYKIRIYIDVELHPPLQNQSAKSVNSLHFQYVSFRKSFLDTFINFVTVNKFICDHFPWGKIDSKSPPFIFNIINLLPKGVDKMKVAHHNAKVVIAHEQNSCCGLKMSSHIRAGSQMNYYCQDNAEMTKEAASNCANGDQDECDFLPHIAKATANVCTR